MISIIKFIKTYFKTSFGHSFNKLSKEEKNEIVDYSNEKIKNIFCYIHNHSPRCKLLPSGKVYFNSCCYEQSREIDDALNKS